MSTYRKKNYRGKRGYSSRPHRRTADSYHQPLPADQSRIPNARHTLTKPDVEACVDALLSGNLTGGKELERFESLLAKLTHSDFALAVNSGSAAFHTAIAALKLEPEDEVLVSTLHDGRVAAMVKLTGARPVFVDCDAETMTMSPDAARAAVNENTKAIFTNNFGGHASDLQALREIAEEHHLVLLDDASHGLGGKYRGHYVGNQADVTCFSFDPDMAITTCLGGAITTNNRPMADWFRLFRRGGIQADPRFFQDGSDQPSFFHEIQTLGMHYDMSEVHAALGRSQLTRLDRHIERRRSIAQVYQQKLENLEGLILPQSASWVDHAYHFYAIQFEGPYEGKRDEIYKALMSASVGVSVHNIPLHRMPLFAGDAESASAYPNAEAYYARAMSLPLFPDLSYKDLERITDVLMKTLAKFNEDGKVALKDGGGDEETTSESERPSKPQDMAPEPEFVDAMQDLESPRDREESKDEDSEESGSSRRGRGRSRGGRTRSSSRRGRRPKDEDAAPSVEAGEQNTDDSPADDESAKGKRGGRLRTVPKEDEEPVSADAPSEVPMEAPAPEVAVEPEAKEEKPKRARRTRTTRKKTKVADEAATEKEAASSDAESKDAKEKVTKPKRATRTRRTTTSRTSKTTTRRPRTRKPKESKDEEES